MMVLKQLYIFYCLCFSYPVRIWAHLMKKPSIVFDIKSPPYVETSMDVISQVFIECFSLEAHKFSKDSPTHKMIFNNEMIHYKEQVKQFYKEISVTESQSDSLRKYLEEVNRVGLQGLGGRGVGEEISVIESQSDSLRKYLEEVNRVGLRLDGGGSGLPRSGKKVWKMKFFPGQDKVGEFQS